MIPKIGAGDKNNLSTSLASKQANIVLILSVRGSHVKQVRCLFLSKQAGGALAHVISLCEFQIYSFLIALVGG